MGARPMPAPDSGTFEKTAGGNDFIRRELAEREGNVAVYNEREMAKAVRQLECLKTKLQNPLKLGAAVGTTHTGFYFNFILISSKEKGSTIFREIMDIQISKVAATFVLFLDYLVMEILVLFSVFDFWIGESSGCGFLRRLWEPLFG